MLSRLKAYKTEKGKFIKVMPKPSTNILSINCKIQVEIDKLPGSKQFLELLLYFLKLPVRIKVPKKGYRHERNASSTNRHYLGRSK